MDHLTFAQLLGSYGEFVGAIAVIVTLGYLALQVRMAANTVKANAAQEILAEWRVNQRDTFITQPENLELYCRGLGSFSTLRDQEQSRLQGIWSQEAFHVLAVIEQRDHGILSDKQVDPYLGYFSSLVRTPGGSEWWHLTKGAYDPRLSEVVDARRQAESHQPNLLDAFPFFRR